MTPSPQRTALVISLALHAALGMWVEVRADERTPPPRDTPRDAWSGNGIEVDAPPDLASALEPAHATAPAAPPTEPTVAPRARAQRAALPAADTPAKREAKAHPEAVAPAGPEASPVSGEAAAPGASIATAESGSTPTFGAAGLPPGVRHLPRAFARAVALANRGDAAWRTLPPGTVGEASIALSVEADGALGKLAFDDDRERDRLLPAVRRLLDNTVLLLAAGRFSLDPRALSPGVMRVRVRVEIVEQSGLSDPDVDPNELNAIDYDPPLPGKPGHGAFLLNSGRRVICWVTALG